MRKCGAKTAGRNSRKGLPYAVPALGILLLTLAACGAQPETAASQRDMNAAQYGDGGYGAATTQATAAAMEGAPMAESAAEGMPAVYSADIPPGEGSKVIQNADVSLQSDRFDETADALRAVAVERGGFIENASLISLSDTQRVFRVTLRVPAESFEEALAYVEGLGRLVSSARSAEDVSAAYYDLAGRLDTKLIEEERVLDMITRAARVEDLLTLEERLAEIRAQIEIYRSQMTDIDRLAAFSTIRAELVEVTRVQLTLPDNQLGARMGAEFTGSLSAALAFLQDAAVFLAGAAVPLALLVTLGLVGWRIYKVKRKPARQRA